jgi:hypothetical protein
MSWQQQAMRSDGASMTTRRVGRGCKAHAHATHTVQVARSRCRLAELAPQPGEVNVDGPVATPVGLAPYIGEQLALRDHLFGALRQGQEQIKLLTRQIDWQPVNTDLARPGSIVRPPTTSGPSATAELLRRRTARSRASTCSIPNGLTT